jgi:hypothetical protein
MATPLDLVLPAVSLGPVGRKTKWKKQGHMNLCAELTRRKRSAAAPAIFYYNKSNPKNTVAV